MARSSARFEALIAIPRPWACFALASVAEFSTLAISIGSRLPVIVFLLATLGWTVMFYRSVVPDLLRNWLLFSLPLFYLLSSTWSIAPVKTLYSSIELIVTFICCIAVATVPHRRWAAAGLAVALILFMMMSFAAGRAVAWEDQGQAAFVGVSASKNFFGHLAALTGIMGLALLAWTRSRAALPMLSLAGLALLEAVAGLMLAHATGSTIAFALAIAMFGGCLLLGRSAAGIKLGFAILAAGALVLYVMFADRIDAAIWNRLLVTFQKTPDLSGRRYLWITADHLIDQHPYFGIGYDSFWTAGSQDAESLWNLYQIRSRSGFNFHSTIREILVDVGYVGALVAIITVAWPTVRLVRRALSDGDVLSSCGVALACYYYARLGVEYTGFGIWSCDTLMLVFVFVAPCVGWGNVECRGDMPVRARWPR